MTRVITTKAMPVFDWNDEINESFDTGMKEIRFEGCGCCADEIVINETNKAEIIASIIRMREIIADVMWHGGITEDEIREAQS